jgi:hypothetical protein
MLLDALGYRYERSSFSRRTIGQIWVVDFLVGPKSSPASLTMSGDQSSHASKADRPGYIAAKVLNLCKFYCVSMLQFSQRSLVFRSLAHDLDDDQNTCEEQRASETDSHSKI